MKPSFLLQNANLILPDRKNAADVLIEAGSISKITQDRIDADEVIDLDGATVYPGFIDIHNHGAIGIDVNEASAEDLAAVSIFLASKGVTSWIPTLVPDSDENYQTGIKSIDEAMKIQYGLPRAQILGVHYEGVFANENMCGALRPKFFKSFKNRNEVSQLPRLKKGKHITTLAPEIENGINLITDMVSNDWVVLIGHTNADRESLDAAFAAGAKHLTHFFNAMSGIHHRDSGVAGWGLTNDGVTFDIIADGIHVDPRMLKFAVETKSAEKVSIISDSVSPTGLDDGDYEIWGEKISVVNRKTQNARGSIAGSVITMLDAVKMMRSLGFSEMDVGKMASMNPAKLLGMEKTRGSVEVGKRADLVVLDDNCEIVSTFIGGEKVC